MIGLVRISSSSDAARYHDHALTEGDHSNQRADNYYLNEQANLTWQGKGAELLGIAGEQVTKEQFVDFLDGKLVNPATGQTQNLQNNSKGEQRRVGYDFTISAPKGVSIVGIVGGDERVIQAHINANRTAMSWLEEHGAQFRIKGAGGENQYVMSGNLLYSTVQHETSRANDPQLHSHNVVVAATYDREGQQWRSLTNDELFQIRSQADIIYKAELARHLREAGYEIVYRTNGIDFDLRGIDSAHLDAFSQRTQQMREALLERGIDPEGASHKARQAAVLDTRERKSDQGRDYLREIWYEKAREAGLDVHAIVEKARQAGPQILPENQLAREGVTRAVSHLAEREQAFKKSELISQSVYFSHGASLGAIERAIEGRLEERFLVERAGKDAPRVTTSAAIADELTLQDSIRRGKQIGVAVVHSKTEFNTHLQRFEARKTEELGKPFKLSTEQVNAARNVLMHEDKFQGIQGDAGTGKTAALEFVQEVARAKGWEIRGIATSTTGARELETATRIPSQTVAAFMIERDERIRMLTAELQQLEVDFAHSPGLTPTVKRVAKRDLHMDSDGYAPGRYVFDSKRGEVLKAATGGWHPLNTMGIKLHDAGQDRKLGAQQTLKQAETFGDRLRGHVTRSAGGIQEKSGRGLATYEIVEQGEAWAARAEHRQQNVEERERLRAYLTKTAQIQNLLNTGNDAGKRMLIVMDESSMTGTKDSARLSEIARDLGARVVLQGDIKQHGSVAAGRAFLQTQQGGINLSKIEETRRFDSATAQQKAAITMAKQGQFARALTQLDTTVSADIYETTAQRYVANRKELISAGIVDPKVGVVTIINDDRKAANVAVRAALRGEGGVTGADFKKQHLDDPKLTQQQYHFVPSLADMKVDRLVALRDYKSLGIARGEMLTVKEYDLDRNLLLLQNERGKMITLDPAKHSKFSFARMEEREYAVGDSVEARAKIGTLHDPARVANGTRGVIVSIDADGAQIRWHDDRETHVANQQMRQIDHAYAHTSRKEQGVTTHREIFLLSDKGAYRLNREATYVATTRARQNTEIVTTPEAHKEIMKNAGKEPEKTTAIDLGANLSTAKISANAQRSVRSKEQQLGRPGPELSM